MMDPLTLFGALLVGHAIADYPLQGDFLARAKNRANPIPGVPWQHGLFPHAAIHGGAVAFLTGIPLLGVVEFILHAAIDDAKCTGKIGFNMDQALHAICKAAYVAALVAWGIA